VAMTLLLILREGYLNGKRRTAGEMSVKPGDGFMED